MCSSFLVQSKGEDIYETANPFRAPAPSEDQLYTELKSYGIRSIPKQQIEYVGIVSQ